LQIKAKNHPSQKQNCQKQNALSGFVILTPCLQLRGQRGIFTRFPFHLYRLDKGTSREEGDS
jgi:hypothetical protein